MLLGIVNKGNSRKSQDKSLKKQGDFPKRCPVRGARDKKPVEKTRALKSPRPPLPAGGAEKTHNHPSRETEDPLPYEGAILFAETVVPFRKTPQAKKPGSAGMFTTKERTFITAPEINCLP